MSVHFTRQLARFNSIASSGETITGLSTAKGLTTIPAGATRVRVTAHDQDVWWTDDGTTPHVGNKIGTVISAGKYDILAPGALSDLQFIEAAASATIWVVYE